MKLGVVGKGGVGKTTVAALLARAYAEAGRRVVAIDTDSNPNLGLSLGLDLAAVDAVPVLPRSVIVGARGDLSVHDVFATYGRATPADVTLLSAIRVSEAGAGCTCAGHASVRSLLGETLDAVADVAIVDMEAGLEHLSRSGGTLAHADVLLVVMEPSRKSVVTAARTLTLAEELGIPHALGVGNKARDEGDVAYFRRAAADHSIPLAAVLAHAPEIMDADQAGTELTAASAAVADGIARIMAAVDDAVRPVAAEAAT